MASFAPIRGTRNQIASTPMVDGQFLVETDQGNKNKVYLDSYSDSIPPVLQRTVCGGGERGMQNHFIINVTDFSGDSITVSCTLPSGVTIVCTQVSGSTTQWECETDEYGVHTIKVVVGGVDEYEKSEDIIKVGEYIFDFFTKLNYEQWITRGGLSISTYPDFATLEADEKAVRKIITLHTPNDYLAMAVDSNDSLLNQILNSDIFAKWINLRDYALDTLSANPEVLTAMTNADKYFYGEWDLNPTIPIMTSNILPYNEASASNEYSSDYAAWKAFDGTYSSSTDRWSSSGNIENAYLDYTFRDAKKINEIALRIWCVGQSSADTPHDCSIIVQGSNDNFTTSPYDICTINILASQVEEIVRYSIPNTQSYSSYRLQFVGYDLINTSSLPQCQIAYAQFYEWGAKGSVPVMISDTAPYGHALASGTSDGGYAWHAFDRQVNDPHSWYHNTLPSWIGYQFVNPVRVRRVMIQQETQTIQYFSKYTLEACNDGVSWNVTLGTWTESEFSPGIIYTHNVNNNKYYLYYRVRLLEKASGVTGNPAVQNLQFYGHELTSMVPVMTSFTAPYGEVFESRDNGSAFGWRAFDGNISTGDVSWFSGQVATTQNPQWIGYQSPEAFKLVCASIEQGVTTPSYCKAYYIEGCNTGNEEDYVQLTQLINTTNLAASAIQNNIVNSDTPYLYHRVKIVDSPSDGVEIQQVRFFGKDYSEKEFKSGTTKKWLYDHGIELEPIDYGTSIKEDSYVWFNHTSISIHSDEMVSDSKIDLTNYSRLHFKPSGSIPYSYASDVYGELGVVNEKHQPRTSSADWVSFINMSPTMIMGAPFGQYIDIVSLTAPYYVVVGAEHLTTRKFDACEWWLE